MSYAVFPGFLDKKDGTKTYKSSHAPNLLAQLNEDRNTERMFCDVTIRTASKNFLIHKCVLGVSSDFFRKMFSSEMKERYEPIINIPDVDPACMEQILNFIYTCEIVISDENVYDLLSAADFLQMQDIKTYCSVYLKETFSEANCIMMWTFARRYNMPQLEVKGDTFITTCFENLLKQEEFKQLCANDFNAFLNLRGGNLPESVIYDAVVSWVRHDAPGRKENFPTVFEQVDLNKLPKMFLKTVVCNEQMVMQSLGCAKLLINSMCDRIQDEVVVSHEFLIIGGLPDGKKVFKFDVATNMCQKVCNMPVEGLCVSAVVVDKLLYVLGGHTNGVSKSVQSVSVVNSEHVTGQWKDLPVMLNCRRSAGCAALDGYIYMCGGLGHDTLWHTACERYHIGAQCWFSIADMNYRRSDFALVATGGRLYAIGGRSKPNCFLDAVECYFPELGCWMEMSAMSEARGRFAAVVLNGEIYAIGGECESDYLSSVEKYDPRTDTWSYVTSLSQDRYNHSACVIQGKIYVTGGNTLLEVYDPTRNEWDITGTLQRRGGAAMVAV